MITVRQIKTGDAEIISKAFQEQGWTKPIEQYQNYVRRNETGEIYTLVAFYNDSFAGYGNIFYNSTYPDFNKNNIPEIVDLNTLIKFRNQKVATTIMDELERIVFKNHTTVGIGVGLVKDYGPAQRMYVKRGYVPNGKGIYHNNINVEYFMPIQADDDLVLYLTKENTE